MSNALFENYSEGSAVTITMRDGEKYENVILVGVSSTIAMCEDSVERFGVLLAEVDNVEEGRAVGRAMKQVTGKTKKEIALDLYAQMPEAKRSEVIEQLMKTAGMSKAGASTYYHNIWKRHQS